MADLSKDLPQKVGNDVAKSFREVVSLTGNLDITYAKRIKSASDSLNRTLGRSYNNTKNSLISATPDKDQLNNLIQERVPPSYANKAYKRFFWRSVYRIVPYLQTKKKTEDRVNEISLLALTTFGVIFEALFVNCNALLSQIQGDVKAGPEEDSYDPELGSATSGLENAVTPSEGNSQHQKTTQDKVERKLKKVTPSASSNTPEEFRDFVGSNSSKVDACRVSLTKHEDSLKEMLKWSTGRTFEVIQESSLKAQQLGQALATASTSARADLHPGTYIACQGLMKAIVELNNIIIQSVALNRSQRVKINTKLKEMKSQSQKNETSSQQEDEDDSW